jgi:hypothetical protein
MPDGLSLEFSFQIARPQNEFEFEMALHVQVMPWHAANMLVA